MKVHLKDKNITGIGNPTGARVNLAKAIPLKTPLIVQIFNIYACNLACKFCHYGLPRDKRPKLTTKAKMSLDLYKKIIDDAKGFEDRLKLLRFCGAGESLLDGDIVEMVRYASERDVAETIELITNGTLLTPETSRALLDAGLTQVRVSIYGLSSAKYLEICGAKVDFDQLVDNVRVFYEENRRRGSRTKIYIKTINCTLDGPEDERTFVELFAKYCDIYAVESVVPNVQGVDYSVWIAEGRPHYNSSGVPLPTIHVCPQPFHLMTICPDGRAVPCSNETMMGIGDCNTQSLPEIWRGDTLRQCQRRMLDGSVAFGGVCTDCAIVQCRPFPEDILDHDAERLKTYYQ